jgi:hypothetical protein
VREVVRLVFVGARRETGVILLQHDAQCALRQRLLARQRHQLRRAPLAGGALGHADLEHAALVGGRNVGGGRIAAQAIDEARAGGERHLLLDHTALIQRAHLGLRQPQAQTCALDA